MVQPRPVLPPGLGWHLVMTTGPRVSRSRFSNCSMFQGQARIGTGLGWECREQRSGTSLNPTFPNSISLKNRNFVYLPF